MTTVKHDTIAPREATIVATVNEAAFVTGLSKQAVNQAIDRGEVRTRRLPRATARSARGLGGAELVYLRVQKPLSAQARRTVYRMLFRLDLEEIPSVIEVENSVKLDIREPLAELRARIQELARIKREVEADPTIRGGEPVFRGTRVPVYMIADFLERGISRTEILEDYPSLNEESLQLAERYAVLYPRRGRPKKPVWQSHQPTRTWGANDLRE